MELNKQIVRSGATRELCTLIEERVAEFNHINISTAFRKLLQASRAGMPRGVVEHSLEALEQRALQTMEDFEPQGIANTLHIMAKKRYRPVSAALLPELEGRLRAVAGDSTPQNIANTLWAFATLGERPGAGVVEALEGRLRAVAGESKPQEVANTLWAACFFSISLPEIFGCLSVTFGDHLLPGNPSQFDCTDLCQLHQVFLMCSLDAELQRSLPESIRRLKDRLGDACRAAFVETSHAVTESRLQKDVSQALQRMELVVEEEYQCPKSGYSIDVRVSKSSAHASSEAEGWVVEVDGPSHFLSCKSPKGKTLIKRRILELLGYNLVSVPYWEWDELQHDMRAQEIYLRCRLAFQAGESSSRLMTTTTAITAEKTARAAQADTAARKHPALSTTTMPGRIVGLKRPLSIW